MGAQGSDSAISCDKVRHLLANTRVEQLAQPGGSLEAAASRLSPLQPARVGKLGPSRQVPAESSGMEMGANGQSLSKRREWAPFGFVEMGTRIVHCPGPKGQQ
jgi:hypothetical protein